MRGWRGTMTSLRLRAQHLVADPLPSERVLNALTIMLEPQADTEARSPGGASLDPSTTTRRHARESTARAPATYAAPGWGTAASACGHRCRRPRGTASSPGLGPTA